MQTVQPSAELHNPYNREPANIGYFLLSNSSLNVDLHATMQLDHVMGVCDEIRRRHSLDTRDEIDFPVNEKWLQN